VVLQLKGLGEGLTSHHHEVNGTLRNVKLGLGIGVLL